MALDRLALAARFPFDGHMPDNAAIVRRSRLSLQKTIGIWLFLAHRLHSFSAKPAGGTRLSPGILADKAGNRPWRRWSLCN